MQRPFIGVHNGTEVEISQVALQTEERGGDARIVADGHVTAGYGESILGVCCTFIPSRARKLPWISRSPSLLYGSFWP